MRIRYPIKKVHLKAIKMFNKSIIASVILTAGFASAASAQQLQQQQPRAMATIISSTPITQTVSNPQQQCHSEIVQVQGKKSGAGAVMGAIAGGAIGNQLGSGAGNTVATMVGLVGGAMAGNAIEGESAPTTQEVQKCETINVMSERTVGYTIVYSYAGIDYSVRGQYPHSPGSQFPVNVVPATN